MWELYDAGNNLLGSYSVEPVYDEQRRAWITPDCQWEDVSRVFTLLPPVPTSITRAQAKLALLAAGLLDNVQPAIDAIPDAAMKAAAQIEWDDRLTFERTNPTLNALASMLDLDSEALDGLFRVGATL